MVSAKDSIKKILEKNKKPLREIIKEVGVSSEVFYAILHGHKRQYKKRTAERISKFINVEINEIEEFKNLYGNSSINKSEKKESCYKEKERKKVEVKILKCENLNCPLNDKKGTCINDVVISGRGSCASINNKSKVVEKIKNKNGKIIFNLNINSNNLYNYIERGNKIND